MGIFSRLKTLISSNVNAIISKAENPEKMLNQLVIDMNEQLVESKQAVALAISDEKKIEREMENQAAQSQEWERKAMLAVNAGKDDLAKEALIRKQEFDKGYTEYKKQWEGQRAAVDKLKLSLRDLQNKIDEANRKKNLLIARAKRAEAQEKIQNTISAVAGNKSAFDAFDRMSTKIDNLEAKVAATAELEDFTANNDLEKQFAELEHADAGGDAMLLALKEKMKALPQN
jgi:phage shock protein A